jgi:hypothetical protein
VSTRPAFVYGRADSHHGLLQPLDDGGVGHAAALAHGLEAVAAAGALELVEQRGHELGVPEQPSGWPRAMAPPLTLTLASCRGRCSFSQASTTEANASLISMRSMSSSVRPARSRTLRVAGMGPVSMVTGSTPTTVKVWKRARGLRPSSGLLLAHDQRSGGAVGDLRGVAGRDLAVLGNERGLELGEGLAVVSGAMPSSAVTSASGPMTLPVSWSRLRPRPG